MIASAARSKSSSRNNNREGSTATAIYNDDDNNDEDDYDYDADSDVDDNDDGNEVSLHLNGERNLITFLNWAMEQLQSPPLRESNNNRSSSPPSDGNYYPGMFLWKKLNLSGRREQAMYVDEPRYVVVRREIPDEDELPDDEFIRRSIDSSSFKNSPFIPPQGRNYLPGLEGLMQRYELFVPNRGKRDKIKDLFKYDDLFFPNRGKKRLGSAISLLHQYQKQLEAPSPLPLTTITDDEIDDDEEEEEKGKDVLPALLVDNDDDSDSSRVPVAATGIDLVNFHADAPSKLERNKKLPIGGNGCVGGGCFTRAAASKNPFLVGNINGRGCSRLVLAEAKTCGHSPGSIQCRQTIRVHATDAAAATAEDDKNNDVNINGFDQSVKPSQMRRHFKGGAPLSAALSTRQRFQQQQQLLINSKNNDGKQRPASSLFPWSTRSRSRSTSAMSSLLSSAAVLRASSLSTSRSADAHRRWPLTAFHHQHQQSAVPSSNIDPMVMPMGARGQLQTPIYPIRSSRQLVQLQHQLWPLPHPQSPHQQWMNSDTYYI